MKSTFLAKLAIFPLLENIRIVKVKHFRHIVTTDPKYFHMAS